MTRVPCARYQVGLALDHDHVAVLAEADCFALAQAHQIVIARLLRADAGPRLVVIVRVDDGAVLEWRFVAAAPDG
jgi:hypothetical protein